MSSAASLRPDYEATLRRLGENRPLDRIVAHYEIERELADTLRAAPAETRGTVYATVYRQLFDRLPDHPQRVSPHQLDRAEAELQPIRSMLRQEIRYLELGCGDASVTHEAAKHCAKAYGLDVTDQLLPQLQAENFTSENDGYGYPLPNASVDLAYSNNLMEHIHPDDAMTQLGEIFRVLVPGGRYFCSTPNRLSGPHDISIYFDHEATGFHLREYDRRTLHRLFKAAGFRRVDFYWTPRGRRIWIPAFPLLTFEALFALCPLNLRTKLLRIGPIYGLLAAKVLATK